MSGPELQAVQTRNPRASEGSLQGAQARSVDSDLNRVVERFLDNRDKANQLTNEILGSLSGASGQSVGTAANQMEPKLRELALQYGLPQQMLPRFIEAVKNQLSSHSLLPGAVRSETFHPLKKPAFDAGAEWMNRHEESGPIARIDALAGNRSSKIPLQALRAPHVPVRLKIPQHLKDAA